MKHLPTHVLLDLADDVSALAEKYIGPKNTLASVRKLGEIDIELLSRMPEGEFITMSGDDGNPVGFEPYMGEDNEYLSWFAYEEILAEDRL